MVYLTINITSEDFLKNSMKILRFYEKLFKTGNWGQLYENRILYAEPIDKNEPKSNLVFILSIKQELTKGLMECLVDTSFMLSPLEA